MIFKQLEIENFGVFTAKPLDFGGPGLQLIVGPNEAGKSTLLQLIRELLFGFNNPRNAYQFENHSGEMAASATIELADGRRLKFRRRKGTRNVVIGEFMDTGQSIDESHLFQLLGSANAELYQHVFGFSLTELSLGEKSLAHANLDEALYGGAIGGLSNFQSIQAELQEEADSLFTPSATKRTINQLLKQNKDLDKRIRDVMVKPRDYENLVKACAQREAEFEDLRAELHKLRQREAHLQRINNAITPWLERLHYEDQLKELPERKDFPPDGEAQFTSLKQALRGLQADVSDYKTELGDIKVQLGQLSLDPELMHYEAEIRQLFQDLTQIAGYRRDIPLRESQSEEKRSQISSRLRELNPDWDLPQLNDFRTTIAQRDAVEKLATERSELDGRIRDLRNSTKRIEKEILQTTKSIDSIQSESHSSGLGQLSDRSNRFEADCEQLDELKDQLSRESAEFDDVLQKLVGQLVIDLDPKVALPLPSETTVREFEDRLVQSASAVSQSEQAITQIEDDIAKAKQALEDFDAGVSVPDRQELLDARQHRQDGWSLIRKKYIEGGEVSLDDVQTWLNDKGESLPDLYEADVTTADKLADERQEKSDAAAKRDLLALTLTRLSAKKEKLETRLNEARSDLQSQQQEWRQLWSRCQFEPLSPPGMLNWMRDYEAMRKLVRSTEAIREKIAALKQRQKEFIDQVRDALGEDTSDTASLIALLKSKAESERKAISRREALADQLESKKADEATLSDEQKHLEAQDASWSKRWSNLLGELRFSEDWDVSLATRVLSELSDLRHEQTQVETLDRRVRDMQAGIEAFTKRTDAIRTSVAGDLMDLPPEDAVKELVSRLESAKEATKENAHLLSQLAKTEKWIGEKENRIEEANEKLSGLLASAEADSESQFLEIAALVTKRREAQRNLDEATKQVRIAQETENESAFFDELRNADIIEIQNELQTLRDTQLGQLQEKYDEALEQVTLAKKGVQQFDGESQAAQLSADLESGRSKLVTAVDRWAALVIMRVMIKRAIEKFEKEHQPQMLKDVERIFGLMTANRYMSIQRKLDEHGTLLVVDEAGTRKEPHQLSTGTREQLYLAIRLAYISRYCQKSEPLPIVMDDVLVNFDPHRLRQTIRVLAELAKQGSLQIIFLTCHDHVVDAVKSVTPESKIIHLASNAPQEVSK